MKMFKNKEGKVRSGWKILMTMVAIYAMMSGVFLIFNSLGMNVLIIIQNVIMIAVPILIWKYMLKKPLADMGLSCIRNHKREFGVGLAFGVLSITLVFVLLLLVGNAEISSWYPIFSYDTIICLFVYSMVGFGEEIFGRGYIMSVLRQTKNVPLIVTISAVIFSLMHIANPSLNILPLINIFLVGGLFAYMYLKSGNIWMPIGYHITWNYFQGSIYGFPVSGLREQGIITTEISENNILNGGEFGPEGGLIVTVIVLIGFVFVKWYYRKKEFNFVNRDGQETLGRL